MADRLLVTGICGSAIAALCCFTPILLVGLGALGLGALAAYLDMVLLPALLGFLLLTGYALWRRTRTASSSPPG
jgi:mercuric ion transport protein